MRDTHTGFKGLAVRELSDVLHVKVNTRVYRIGGQAEPIPPLIR